jgi:hypothetical protein
MKQAVGLRFHNTAMLPGRLPRCLSSNLALAVGFLIVSVNATTRTR